tara:strand:- start:7503 stop:8927 length:1425 start_codon:yes stop_codon:yes gene_type:complete
MKLKLNFVSKIPKLGIKNELIFINNKNFKYKTLDRKEILENELFKEKKIIQRNQVKSNYILINCIDQKKSSDFENIGSKLFDFLSNYKIENTFINLSSLKITNVQIERILHGLKLKSYSFDIYKTKKNTEKLLSVYIVGKKNKSILKIKLDALAEGVFLTRDLVSEPGNILHPDEYAKRISNLKKFGIKVSIYDKKKLKKMGCGALIGVGQGSIRGSYIVTMEWKGASSKTKPLAFVGKGVCFDTGGISLKPAKFMEDMTYDMAGSAVVVGLMKNFALRKAKINAVGVVGLVENMPGGNAQRPGDIVKSYSGKTIEVLNTDAEGRLVLADALSFTEEKFNPNIIIDLATLTGAIIVSLGSEYAGLFSNNDKLSKQLYDAGELVEEKVWRMPLHKNYDKLINSKNADMQNINYIGGAGSTTAAQFLQRFILNKTPWAHLDIAGMSFSKYAGALNSGGATGFGVRLLNKFVEENYE